MGTRRTGDGGDWPPEGDRSPDDQPELPLLPPEWGAIVIPDDASALTAEARQVRRELARRRRRASGPTDPAIGVPLLIMSVAVLITLISIVGKVWSGAGPPERPQPDHRLPELILVDAEARPTPLTGLIPAAILLVSACDCAELVTQTVDAAPPGVTVVVVATAAPPADPNLPTARFLADPDQTLREAVGLGPPDGAAAVVLVDRDRQIAYVGRARTLASYRTPLRELAPPHTISAPPGRPTTEPVGPDRAGANRHT